MGTRPGTKLSEEHRRAIGLGLLGHKTSLETRRKISIANKGRVRTEETRRKQSEALKGRVAWNKGKKLGFTPKCAYKKGQKPCLKAIEATKARIGPKHPRWKGGYENRLRNNRNRYLLKKGIDGDHTLQEWIEMKKSFKFTCPRCKRKEPEITLSVDHIIPITKGGSNNIENIQPLCRSCNSTKNNKIEIYHL